MMVTSPGFASGKEWSDRRGLAVPWDGEPLAFALSRSFSLRGEEGIPDAEVEVGSPDLADPRRSRCSRCSPTRVPLLRGECFPSWRSRGESRPAPLVGRGDE
jgi:hypothetical protein